MASATSTLPISKRRLVGEALRALSKSASEKTEPDLERNISHSLDAINFILARAGCPTESRAFIDSVIGAADGRVVWFEASDLEIGMRMLGTEAEGKTPGAIKKRVQRDRKAFNDWQRQEGYLLIEADAGGKRDGQFFKTRYRVPMLMAAAEALRSTRDNALWSRNPTKALSRAAKTALLTLEGSFIKRERFNRPRQDEGSLLTRYRKTILTHASKACEVISRAGGNPHEFLEKLSHEILSLSTHDTSTAPDGPVHTMEHDEYSNRQDNGAWPGASTSCSAKPPDVPASSHVDKSVPPSTPSEARFQMHDMKCMTRIEQPDASGSAWISSETATAEALEMVEAFESAGASAFDVTITDDQGRACEFNRGRRTELLRQDVPSLLSRSERQRLNMIIRPRVGPDLRLIQLDDLPEATVGQISEHAFLVIQTSPASFQAWVAVKDADGKLERRLKKGCGSDPTASGATRIAGSTNFKQKHAPNYPRVHIVKTNRGRIVTAATLDQAGLLASREIEQKPPRHAPNFARRSRSLVWPSYKRCLDDAPSASNHEGPDRSHADFEFCLISVDRGWLTEDIAQRLMLESEKASREGFGYALHTAQRAAAVVASKHAGGRR